MGKRRCSEERLRGILRQVEKGPPLVDVCREEGMSDATLYRCKAPYGGLEVRQLQRVRHREAENHPLKQAVADLSLDTQARKDITAKNG